MRYEVLERSFTFGPAIPFETVEANCVRDAKLLAGLLWPKRAVGVRGIPESSRSDA